MALLAVARTHSLHSARAELGLASTSSVHHLLERLAASLGLDPLITASVKGRVDLSPDGELVLPHASALVQAFEAFRISGHVLRIACYPTVAGRAAPTILSFAEEHRRDRIEVVFYGISGELRSDQGVGLVARAAAGEIDVVIAPSSTAARGLARRELYSWSLRVVAHDDDPLRHRDQVRIDELADRRLIAAPHGHMSRQLFDEAAARAPAAPIVAMELADQYALRAIATAGRAYVAAVPDDAFGAPDHQLGPQLLDSDGEPLGGRYALFYPEHQSEGRTHRRSEWIRQLADALHEALGDELPIERLTRR